MTWLIIQWINKKSIKKLVFLIFNSHLFWFMEVKLAKVSTQSTFKQCLFHKNRYFFLFTLDSFWYRSIILFMWKRDSWNTKCQYKRYSVKEVNTLYSTTEKRLRIQYRACRPDVACLWYIFIIKTLLHIDKYIENASEGALCSQTSIQPTDWLNDRTSVQLNSLFKLKWHEFEFVIVSVLVDTILVFLSFFRFALFASHSHTLIAQEFA